MTGEFFIKQKRAVLLGMVASTLAIAACSDNLNAGKSCPLLCPEQAITLQRHDYRRSFRRHDRSRHPVDRQRSLSHARRRTAIRSTAERSSATTRSRKPSPAPASIDSTITEVDSAELVMPIAAQDTLRRPTAPVTIEAYDVDTAATDTVASILATLFRPDRFLGSKTFAPESLTDTLRIPISTDTVLDRIKNGKKLRVGLRLVARPGYDIRVGAVERRAVGRAAHQGVQGHGGLARARDADLDDADGPAVPLWTAVGLQHPREGRDADQPDAARASAGRRLAGPSSGSTSRRGSSTRRPIVRASLLVTQSPNRFVDAKDSIKVYPIAVLSTPAVTDVTSLLQFVGNAGEFNLDSLFIAPGDSGVRSFEIVGLTRLWKNQPATVAQRALALLAAAPKVSVPRKSISSRAARRPRCDRDSASRSYRRSTTGCRNDTTPSSFDHSLARGHRRADRHCRSRAAGFRAGQPEPARLRLSGRPDEHAHARRGRIVGGNRPADAGEPGERRVAAHANDLSSRRSRSFAPSRRPAARTTPRRRVIRTCSARFPWRAVWS